MGKTVIETEQIRDSIIKYLSDNDTHLTPREVETVCDTYIRYYVLRVDPAALEIVRAEVLKQ